MTEKMQVGSLVEDLSVYPRGSVSDIRVSDLMYAIDGGAKLPPPVADRKTRIIIDGVHRTRAWRKRLGAEAEIDVDVQEFADSTAMLLASAKLNSAHGLPLARYDQRTVAVKARALGAGDEEIARALGVTVSRLVQIQVLRAETTTGEQVPLKRGLGHLSGNILSPAQVEEIRKARGAPYRAKVSELTRQLSLDMLPVQSDPDLRDALAELAVVITAVLGQVRK